MAETGKAVLAGVRVLEIGNAAARFAGWLLRGLGATVTRPRRAARPVRSAAMRAPVTGGRR